MASIFTKIISGEIPSYKIAETTDFYAFLDIMPLALGHVLVVPKKEIDYIFDIEDTTLSGLMSFSKRIAKAIDKAVPCKRVGVAVIGLEVPHAHIHLVPLQNVSDINFEREKLSFPAETMQEVADKIKSAFEG